MDYERAEKTLREYEQLVTEYQALAEPDAIFPVLRAPARRVNWVLARLTPDKLKVTGVRLRDHAAALALVQQALDVIQAIKRMKAAEGESGDPVLPMNLLDPVIYDAAIRHWQAGHYRIAVAEASTNLDEFTRRRLRRTDGFGTALMDDAFTGNPPLPGKSRLRCPDDQSSQQAGALSFARGCVMAIRNPAHHQKPYWNPVTAFHHLVALSQVAWWVRTWKVETYVPPAEG